MKRFFAIICALALLITGTAAFAAGETPIWNSGDGDFGTEQAVMFGDTLYMYSPV